jgi:ankyrin repeat protein
MSLESDQIPGVFKGVLALGVLIMLTHAFTIAKAGDGPIGLWGAAARGDIGEITRFLDSGVDINGNKDGYGLTPLMWAAGNAHLEAVQVLIDKGAEIDGKGRDGRTAVMCTAWESALIDQKSSGKNYSEVLKLLLEKGADVNAKDEVGRTALMWAAGRGNLKALRLLLKKGADVNAKDRSGGTALMGAASRGRTVLGWTIGKGHLKVIEALLEKGADLNAQDDTGRTALEMARQDGYKAVEQFLETRVATE